MSHTKYHIQTKFRTVPIDKWLNVSLIWRDRSEDDLGIEIEFEGKESGEMDLTDGYTSQT